LISEGDSPTRLGRETYLETDCNHLDGNGFDVLFGRGSAKAKVSLKNANPAAFNYEDTITNTTGTDQQHGRQPRHLHADGARHARGLRSRDQLRSQVGSQREAGLQAEGQGHRQGDQGTPDDKNGGDGIRVNVQYKSYQAWLDNGSDCNASAGYSDTVPAGAAAKCIRITGFTIPKNHRVTVRIKFELRGKDVVELPASPDPKTSFRAAFLFRDRLMITFPSPLPSPLTRDDVLRVAGGGKQVTALGGFVLSGGAPAAGYRLRLWTGPAPACGTGSPVADVQVDADGFYFAGPLQKDVKWLVQVCNGGTQVAIRKLSDKLKNKEFDEEDFSL
jgi:hypothetical protein